MVQLNSTEIYYEKKEILNKVYN